MGFTPPLLKKNNYKMIKKKMREKTVVSTAITYSLKPIMGINWTNNWTNKEAGQIKKHQKVINPHRLSYSYSHIGRIRDNTHT